MNIIFALVALLLANLMFLLVIYKSTGVNLTCTCDELRQILSRIDDGRTIHISIGSDLLERERNTRRRDLRNNISE